MRIGNYDYNIGDSIPLNKWLFSIEVLKCPPQMIGVIKPCVFLVCTKIIEAGEPWKVNGKPEVKKGGWWSWTVPYGLIVDIRLIK